MLTLNKCTLIQLGPPKSVYVKVSIEGKKYKVTQASNDECIDANTSLLPFGECADGKSSQVFDDIFGIFINLLDFGDAFSLDPDGDYSVFPSDFMQSSRITIPLL